MKKPANILDTRIWKLGKYAMALENTAVETLLQMKSYFGNMYKQ